MEIVSKAEMIRRLSGKAELEAILQKIAEGIQGWAGEGESIIVPVDRTLTTKQMDIIRSKCPQDWNIRWSPTMDDAFSEGRGGNIIIS